MCRIHAKSIEWPNGRLRLNYIGRRGRDEELIYESISANCVSICNLHIEYKYLLPLNVCSPAFYLCLIISSKRSIVMFLYKIIYLLCSLIIVSLCTLFLLRSVSYFSLSLFAAPLSLIVFAFIKKDKGQAARSLHDAPSRSSSSFFYLPEVT